MLCSKIRSLPGSWETSVQLCAKKMLPGVSYGRTNSPALQPADFHGTPPANGCQAKPPIGGLSRTYRYIAFCAAAADLHAALESLMGSYHTTVTLSTGLGPLRGPWKQLAGAPPMHSATQSVSSAVMGFAVSLPCSKTSFQQRHFK